MSYMYDLNLPTKLKVHVDVPDNFVVYFYTTNDRILAWTIRAM